VSESFNPEQAFNKEFQAQLDSYPSDVDWIRTGRASKANPHGEDAEWWKAEGPKMVQRWIDWREQTPWEIWITPNGDAAIELELYIHLDYAEPVKMFVDRVFSTAPGNQRPVVLDIKSGSRTPDNHMQLGLYKVGLELQYPDVQIAGGCYWMARTAKTTDIVTLHQYTPRLYAEYMRRLRVGRQMGVFLPNISNLCRSCKVGRFCAANGGADKHADPDSTLMGR
jgi:hypothetical protein